MQWSVRINEGYDRLVNPLKRAVYLCELHGEPIKADTNTVMPPAFLMQQIEWREALNEAKTLQQLEEIALETQSVRRGQLSKIEQAIDINHDFKTASQEVRSLMFIERFATEVDARIDQVQA
ncbi:MAG: co-chaperone Hsc20 [Polaromonas sp.]|nr:co-chaperone Hsc20 [Polaromonas sp.]